MDQLQDWIPHILGNPNKDVNDEIFAYLAKVDIARLKELFRRITVLRNYKITGRSQAAQEKRGRRSRIMGKAFENLINCLFKDSKALKVASNIRTTTSEIDFLIAIQPAGKLIPFLNGTSTHLIGEAKFYQDSPKTEWVNELAGILSTHSSEIAILFVGSAPKTIHREIRQAIALHAQNRKYILPFGITQINEIISGENFLRILSKQYILTSNHTSSIMI